MVHLYCGDGKGKTSAAVGLTVRAAGNGFSVVFAQFMKARQTGELIVLGKIENVHIMRSAGVEKFTFQMKPDELKAAEDGCRKLLDNISQYVHSQSVDMIVLDEALTAVEKDLLPESELRDFIDRNRVTAEIVLTGRIPEPWMIECADYVTDMEKIKHPFDTGLEARKGIEY